MEATWDKNLNKLWTNSFWSGILSSRISLTLKSRGVFFFPLREDYFREKRPPLYSLWAQSRSVWSCKSLSIKFTLKVKGFSRCWNMTSGRIHPKTPVNSEVAVRPAGEDFPLNSSKMTILVTFGGETEKVNPSGFSHGHSSLLWGLSSWHTCLLRRFLLTPWWLEAGELMG